MGTYIRIALRNIWKQKKRSLLLASAIVCGLTLITLAGSFSNGAGRNIIRMGTTLRTGHLNVTGLVKIRSTVFQELPDMDKILTIIRKTLPGIQRIESRISLMAGIFNPSRELGSRRGFVYGVDFGKKPGCAMILSSLPVTTPGSAEQEMPSSSAEPPGSLT